MSVNRSVVVGSTKVSSLGAGRGIEDTGPGIQMGQGKTDALCGSSSWPASAVSAIGLEDGLMQSTLRFRTLG